MALHDDIEVEGTIWPADQPELWRAGATPLPLEIIDPLFGSHRGVASRRPFFFDEISLPLEPRSLRGLEITLEGIDRVKRHLARMDHDPANDQMLARLEKILMGDLAFSVFDARFYAHELRELDRFEAAGWPIERPPREILERLWNNEHTATLEEYGFREDQQPLYHPDIEDDDG